MNKFKCMKVIIILLMVLGIAFSILNFFPRSLNAVLPGVGEDRGVYVGPECENNGNLCDLWMEGDD